MGVTMDQRRRLMMASKPRPCVCMMYVELLKLTFMRFNLTGRKHGLEKTLFIPCQIIPPYGKEERTRP